MSYVLSSKYSLPPPALCQWPWGGLYHTPAGHCPRVPLCSCSPFCLCSTTLHLETWQIFVISSKLVLALLSVLTKMHGAGSSLLSAAWGHLGCESTGGGL